MRREGEEIGEPPLPLPALFWTNSLLAQEFSSCAPSYPVNASKTTLSTVNARDIVCFDNDGTDRTMCIVNPPGIADALHTTDDHDPHSDPSPPVAPFLTLQVVPVIVDEASIVTDTAPV